jgi:hypothetical protein
MLRDTLVQAILEMDRRKDQVKTVVIESEGIYMNDDLQLFYEAKKQAYLKVLDFTYNKPDALRCDT